jgi:hypothetical protein
MITTDCTNCGHAVLVFAGSCQRCGAANRSRLGALAVAGSLVLLLVAVGVAAVAFIRWQGGGTGREDLAWLTTAMHECDVEAEKAPDTIHFLVVPMASLATDDATWRAKSLNDIGNAILLTQSDTLDGLKSGSLRLANEEYEFIMRDETTNAHYKWTPSVGVKKFLIPNATQVTGYKVQFKTRHRTNDAQWGATFEHRKGSCYWVNAIIAN